ncbi:MAG: hypothetical protein BGP01_03545 [Paludibacter sp. 47-17]|nr:MAG: hypothetical protein BGP01_03545 [Paludibacter sp. 47-17]
MKPVFLFTTPELDEQLARIQKAVRLSMNGVVADSMKDRGIGYKKNYGVTTLRLKEIARDFEPGQALADRLWLLGIRETMILASMLAPASSFPEGKARTWSAECTNLELIEQTTMNLFQHLPYAAAFALECIHAEKAHVQSVGFTLALRVSTTMTKAQVAEVTRRGLELACSTDSYLIKTIATCLARFTRIDRDTALAIRQQIPEASENEWKGLLVIRKFVSNELIFLGYEQDNS